MNLWGEAIIISLMALPIAFAYDRLVEIRRERNQRIITFLEELENWEDDE